MTTAASPTRTRLLALALAAFGTVSACGGSDSSAETTTGATSSGGESTAAATSATTPADVPASTEGQAAPGTPTGSTECGHGACA